MRWEYNFYIYIHNEIMGNNRKESVVGERFNRGSEFHTQNIHRDLLKLYKIVDSNDEMQIKCPQSALKMRPNKAKL